jgi:protein-disulfide isomerase
MSTLTLAVGKRDHAQGPANAPVTLVEYGDYQCPSCGAAYPIVKALRRRLGDGLRFVFRNFPLERVHPHAEDAAEAAEAAGAQGKFWEMHDFLFENQDELDLPSLMSYAREAQVDTERWALDMETRAFTARVKEDFLSGVRSGVNGTPTFFINGHRHDGPFDEDALLAALGRLHSAP